MSRALPARTPRLGRTLAALVALVALAAVGAAGPAPAAAQTVLERREWRAAFDTSRVAGTFALRRLGSDTILVHDLARARRPYLPASTFKIPNSLIALETGVVRDERQRFPYRWPPAEIAAWNRDHTFRTALKYSVVPVYQIIAREIGPGRYRDWLRRLRYGNEDPRGRVDRFWLDGALRTTALEQIDFLARLAELRLPLSERSQRIVHDMLVVDANACYVMRAKTGLVGNSAAAPIPAAERVGWYVGWVESDSARWAFAMNLDAAAPGAAGARQTVTRAVLARAGVIPPAGCPR